MSASIADQYMIIVAVTLLFTVLALIETEQNSKSIILQIFAGMLWLVSGFAQIIAGDTTSILTYALSYLWYAFAMIFFMAAIYNGISLMNMRRKPQI